jgi:hypothetical protein
MLDFLKEQLQKQASRLRLIGEAQGYNTVANGQVEDPRSIASQDDRKRLVKHLKMVEKTFNEWLTKFDIPMRVCTKTAQEEVINGENSLSADAYSRVTRPRPGVTTKTKSGILYPSHIESVCNTLRILLSTNRSITAIGALQSGKTTFNVALMFLAPAVFVVTNVLGAPITYIPMLFTPNATELADESLEALRNLFAIYGKIELIGIGKRLTDPMTPLKYLFKACCGDFNATMPIRYEENVLHRNFGDAHHHVEFSVNRPSSHNFVPQLVAEIQKHLDNYLEPLIIVDEVDYGAQKGSVLDAFLSSKVVYTNELNQRVSIKLIDLCADSRFSARCVNVSATPATVISSKANVEIQYLAIGDNYHGFNMCYGNVIDKRRVDCTQPALVKFSEVAKWSKGMAFFPFLNKAGYSEEAFERWFAKLEASGVDVPDMTANQYKKAYIETMAAAINYFTRLNKGKRDDAIIRLFSNDVVTTVVKDLMKSGLIKKAHLCAWTHKNVKNNPLDAFMTKEREKVGADTPMVVFVTGKARRGNPVPASVRYGVDFVWEAGTQVAQQQGILGRMCGYNKYDKERGLGNFVIMNDREIEAIEEFVGHDFSPRHSKKKILNKVGWYSDVMPKDLSENAFIHRGLSPQTDRFLDKMDALAQVMLEPMPRRYGKTAEVTAYRSVPKGADVLEERDSRTGRVSKAYPLFKWFNPRWVNDNPKVSRLVMGTDSLQVYGPNDADAHYHLSEANPSYVRASWSWDRSTKVTTGEDDRVSKKEGQGSYQVRNRRTLNRGGKNAPPIIEPLIKVVRVDADGNVVPGVILNHRGVATQKGLARPGDKWKVLGVVFRVKKPEVSDMTIPIDVRPYDDETIGRGFIGDHERETELLTA